MQNENKPTSSVFNSPKVSIGETWDTWNTAWQDETRTWDELGKLIDNINKPFVGVICLAQENGFCLLQENGKKLVIDNVGGIVNINKP